MLHNVECCAGELPRELCGGRATCCRDAAMVRLLLLLLLLLDRTEASTPVPSARCVVTQRSRRRPLLLCPGRHAAPRGRARQRHGAAVAQRRALLQSPQGGALPAPPPGRSVPALLQRGCHVQEGGRAARRAKPSATEQEAACSSCTRPCIKLQCGEGCTRDHGQGGQFRCCLLLTFTQTSAHPAGAHTAIQSSTFNQPIIQPVNLI